MIVGVAAPEGISQKTYEMVLIILCVDTEGGVFVAGKRLRHRDWCRSLLIFRR